MSFDRLPFRVTFRLAVAMILTLAVVVGYLVVAIVADVPEDFSVQRPTWPGQGFVILAGIGIIGLASLLDALRPGRARGSALQRPQAGQPGQEGGDERPT